MAERHINPVGSCPMGEHRPVVAAPGVRVHGVKGSESWTLRSAGDCQLQPKHLMIAEKAVDIITRRERHGSTQTGHLGADRPSRVPHLQQPYRPPMPRIPKESS